MFAIKYIEESINEINQKNLILEPLCVILRLAILQFKDKGTKLSVKNNSKEKAISLHVYAKPYDKCNIFYPEQNSIKRAKLKYYSKFGQVC